MPIQSCTEKGLPGYRYGGKSNKCYTYTPGNEKSRKEAKRKAIIQSIAIKISKKRQGKKE